MTSKAKITEAIKALDPFDDGNWTGGGYPTVHAVAEALDDHSITREDVDAAARDWNREAAMAANPKPSRGASIKGALKSSDPTRYYSESESAPEAKVEASPAKSEANPFPAVYPANNAFVIAVAEYGPVVAQYRNEANDTMTSKHGGFFSRVGAGGYTMLEGKVTAWAPMPDLTVAPAPPGAGMSSIGA